MTNEERDEALAIMNVIIHMIEKQYDNDRVEKAVDTAIAALKAQPCMDCVSREAVIEVLDWHEHEKCEIENYIREIAEDIKTLPPVQPERPKGEWLYPYYDKRYKKCSECGKEFSVNLPWNAKYCPNCGANNERRSEKNGRNKHRQNSAGCGAENQG